MELVKNRRAYYDYEIVDKLIAGIILKGYEVKALREGNANLDGTFVKLLDGKPFIVNMHIGKYSKQSQDFIQQSSTSKALLLTKHEISKLYAALSQKGLSSVPLSIFTKGDFVKVEVGIVRGKKKYEKRDTLKERQIAKDMALKEKERTY